MHARAIDHLVLAVRDLDEAGRLYERLGFQVGTRNRHPWGTENRIVQFADKSFLELITVGEGATVPPHEPRRFSFGAFVRDTLARREGLVMLVLDSADAESDATAFRHAGIGDFEPFFFERRARRPDGSETRVAFTLAFAQDEGAPEIGFFVCQQHCPENFWNPAFQHHLNGAQGIAAVVLAAAMPQVHRHFLEAFGGAAARPDGESFSIPLARGRLDVLEPEAAAAVCGRPATGALPRLEAFAVRVPNLLTVESTLAKAEIPSERRGARVVVTAFGVAIAFEAG